MLYNQTELAELVCTRISHDLIGNIGALSATMELLDECGNVLDKDTKNILVTATEILTARQKFFRIAFGIKTVNLKNDDLKTICENYLATIGSKAAPINFSCNNLSVELARIICLSVMLGAEVCIKGGHINIETNAKSIIITTKTDFKLAVSKLKVYEEITKAMKPEDNASQYIALIYLKELLGSSVKFDLDYSEQQMILTIN